MDAMGYFDTRGIWIYDTTDHVTPISPYMNLGQQSISDALAAQRTALTPINTGWVDLILNGAVTAVSGFTPQVKRYGDVVYMRGRVVRTSTGWASGDNAVATLPTASGGITFAPGQTHECGPVMYGTSSQTGRLYITADGLVRAWGMAAIGNTVAATLTGRPWMV